MRVGIIGQGYLGYSIASKLHGMGIEVVSLSRSPKPNCAWQNLIKIDVAKSAFKGVSHLLIASGNSNPGDLSLSDELRRTLNVLVELNITWDSHIVYLSSGAVYGNSRRAKSEVNEPHPTTRYGLIKLKTENQLRDYTKQEVSILRIGNLYSSQKPTGLFRAIRQSYLNSTSIPIFGLPTDARDYLNLDTFEDLIVSLLCNMTKGSIYNIGSGTSFTLNEIVSKVNQIVFPNAINIAWSQARLIDVRQTRLNCENVYFQTKLEMVEKHEHEILMENYLGALLLGKP